MNIEEVCKSGDPRQVEKYLLGYTSITFFTNKQHRTHEKRAQLFAKAAQDELNNSPVGIAYHNQRQELYNKFKTSLSLHNFDMQLSLRSQINKLDDQWYKNCERVGYYIAKTSFLKQMELKEVLKRYRRYFPQFSPCTFR